MVFEFIISHNHKACFVQFLENNLKGIDSRSQCVEITEMLTKYVVFCGFKGIE